MAGDAGVGSNHPEYDARKPEWKMLRDAYGGENSIKAAGAEYLPQLDQQNAEEYNAYRKRATWFNATRRTVYGMHSMIFRRDVEYKLPAAIDEQWSKDIDRRGTDINTFCQMLVAEVMVVGRSGILLDLPEFATAAVVPHLCMYCAESIVDWREESINGVRTLVHLVLEENVDTPDDSGFGHKMRKQRLVLKLIAGVYFVQKFALQKNAQTNTDEWVAMGPQFAPTVRGAAINYIPFQFVSHAGLEPQIVDSSILDLALLNVSHYRTAADLEHGCHYVALPTPVVSGMSGDVQNRNLPLGPTNVIWLPMGGEAKMLEFQGKGLSTLVERLAAKEQQMIVLGSRLLEAQKAAVEASDTIKMRQSGDRSVLAQLSRQTSRALTALAQWAVQWAGGTVPDDLKIELNTEFYDQPLTPDAIRAMVQAWQAGAISQDTMLWNFKRGDVIPHTVTAEDEKDKIEANPPGAAAGIVGVDDDDEEDDGAAAA